MQVNLKQRLTKSPSITKQTSSYQPTTLVKLSLVRKGKTSMI